MSKIFKSLTFIALSFALSREVFADAGILNQEKFKTHLRWNLFAGKDDLYISKKGSSVFIKTLNVSLFENLKKDIAALAPEKAVIVAIRASDNEKSTDDTASTIEVKLASEEIELFSFYRDRDKKYVVDFWSDTESLTPHLGDAASATKAEEAQVEEPKIVSKPELKKEPKAPLKKASAVISKKVPEVKPEPKKVEAPVPTLVATMTMPALPGLELLSKPEAAKTAKEEKLSFSRNKGVRDFRYGASFIFDYNALSPVPQSFIDLENKTAEEFYPIQNRNFEKDNKEAHVQLTINFYRQKKWGLMYKSIKLYEEKYGDSDVRDIHEYLKANALLRENMVKNEEGPIKMAIGMYKNIVDRTKDYELSKGIMKYLLQYSISQKQYIDSLQLAKRLYVSCKEKFDMEDAQLATEYMFYSLAQLNQVDKIRDLASDKSVQKLLNSQLRLAYEYFAMSSLKQNRELVKSYESIKKSLAKPVDPSIIFNVAEAYFRLAEYDKAMALFDEFVTKNSHMTYSSFSRVRLALIYDILDKDYNELVKLYKTAINRSQDASASLEAKIRYVALRSVRVVNPSVEDRETRVFLEKEDLTKNIENPELIKLLWLVRFRTFIVDKEYAKALSYLAALPLDKMNPTDLKVFENDGAEVVYGMIIKDYRDADYSHLVKLWEVYKDRFLTKVAVDPYMNFVVGHAYLKLGLTKGFERLMDNFEKLKGNPVKTFPDWNDIKLPENATGLLAELKVIKEMNEKNWERAKVSLGDYEKIAPNNNKVHYYRGMIASAEKDYKTTTSELETYLGNQNSKEIYDSVEIAQMIQAYMDSLYETNQLEKFSKVAKALLQDVGNYGDKNPYMNKVKERISYLSLEILAGQNAPDTFEILEKDVRDFEKKFKDSMYLGRLKYLLGVAFVSNRKVEEGKQIFKNLLDDKKTEEYIKELVRTELSTLKIKEKTL